MNPQILLLALLAQPAAPASQPASRAALKAGGTGADVTAQAIIMVDLDESALNMQESWTLNNNSGKAIGPEHLVIPLGAARLLRVDEDITDFAAREDSTSVYATEGMGAGSKTASFAYLKDISGATATMTRRIPVNVERGTLILPALDDLRVESNYPMQDRVSDMNGRRFLVYDIPSLPAGTNLELTFKGLPSHSSQPRFFALLGTLLVVGWMVWALRSGHRQRREAVQGAMSPVARRDRIVRAIELLERDFENETIKERRYQRRHGELMAELAVVLREIDVSGLGADAR